MSTETAVTENMIRCRARFWGHYKGKPFVYTDPDGDGSLYIFPDDEELSYYIWEDGNNACDHNRGFLLGEDINRCSHEIYIDFIQPLDAHWPIGVLLESIQESISDGYVYELDQDLQKIRRRALS